MAALPDDPVRAVHESSVTQAGFAIIPMVVLLHQDLSSDAKLVYGYLKHVAWRGKTGEATGTARQVIASDLAIGEKRVTAAVRELRDTTTGGDQAVPLLRVVRRGQGHTNLYVVNDPREADQAVLDGQEPPLPARARLMSEVQETNGVAYATPAREEPPPIVHVDGRNVAWDALCEATGVDPESPRTLQVAAALNGRLDKAGKLKAPGIRHLFWIECVRWADEHDATDRLDLAYDEPDTWALALARRIKEKADRYTAVYPGAALSAQALRNHWLDLERAPRAAGGLSPQEIEAFGG